jgi:hypothetical protein
VELDIKRIGEMGIKLISLGTIALVFSTNSAASLIGGVEFPDGAISFADQVNRTGSGLAIKHLRFLPF